MLDCRRQIIVDGKKKHTKEYAIWSGMRGRCNNPNNQAYSYYGERGIRVCDRWNESFDAFLEDMGRVPSDGMSIERLNVNEDYSPNNCIWADDFQQANNKRSNVLITFNGETKTMSNWARELGINYKALWHQLNRQGLDLGSAEIKQIKYSNDKDSKVELTKEILHELYITQDMNCREVAAKTGWGKKMVQEKLLHFEIVKNPNYKRCLHEQENIL